MIVDARPNINTSYSPDSQAPQAELDIFRLLEIRHTNPDAFEARERISTGVIDFREDLSEIAQIQGWFDKALGVKTGVSPSMVSYRPVLDLWMARRVDTQSQKENFGRYIRAQMVTNLRERYHAAKSVVRFRIDKEGNAYNELYPYEPFDTVLQRGLAYRRDHSSTELEREEAEVRGWPKIRTELGNPQTPKGTKKIVVSLPSESYKDNFVDIYEAEDDPLTGGRIIRLTRFASSMNNQEYRETILKKDPKYFDGMKGGLDAFLLENPLDGDSRSAEEIFETDFAKRKDARAEENFQKLLKPCMPLIDYYAEVISRKNPNPLDIALAFNAVLRMGDQMKQWLDKGIEFVKKNFANIQDQASYLGRLPILALAVGCGMSIGFNFGGKLGGINMLFGVGADYFSNSVAKFGLLSGDSPDGKGPLYFECPGKGCGKILTRPFGGLRRDPCDSCGQDVRC